MKRVAPQNFVMIGLALLLASCTQKMASEAKIPPMRESRFFANQMSARPPVPHAVSRDELRTDEFLYQGKENGKLVDRFPFTISRQILDRGRERFNINCSPCHGQTGAGDGMVVRRGFKTPPSYHQDRLRTIPVGHFFDVMTHGFGVMPSYASQIEPKDRWAIAAYIRALQLSQNARVTDLTEQDRAALERSPE